MLKTRSRPMTRHDYQLFPEGGPQWQLVDGEFHMGPAPHRFHQDISRNLGYILLRYLEDHPIGKLYQAPFDVYLGDVNVVQPDILFFANARLGHLTDAGAEGAPDLVVEILSKRNAKLDRGPKKEIYARFGAEELWLIDPETLQVEVYRLQEDAEVPKDTLKTQPTLSTPLFAGLEIPLGEIFKR
jgi:Uma2 family endonuclease